MTDDEKLKRLQAIGLERVDAFKHKTPIERIVVHHDEPLDEDEAWQVSIHEMIVFHLAADQLHALIIAYEGYEVFAGVIPEDEWGEEFEALCSWLKAKHLDQVGVFDTGQVVTAAGSFMWFGSLVFGLSRSSLLAYYYKRQMNLFDLWRH